MKTRFGAERVIDAPAVVVYHCLADYREHHRPGGFLPPAFEQLEITTGGVGAGTEYRLLMALGGRRRAVSTTVSEPVPGHKLVETGSGIQTTFTVEQTVEGAQVRFDTVLDEGGLQGIPEPFVRRPDDRPRLRGRAPAPRGPRQGPFAAAVMSARALPSQADRNPNRRARPSARGRHEAAAGQTRSSRPRISLTASVGPPLLR